MRCQWRLEESLWSHPGWSWLDPLFSVWRKWWRGPRPPALSRSVSNTSSLAGASVCMSVCMCVLALEGKVNPFLCKQSHHTGQNTFQPPQFPTYKVLWFGNREEWGGGGGSRWKRACSTFMWLHIPYVSKMLLCARAWINAPTPESLHNPSSCACGSTNKNLMSHHSMKTLTTVMFLNKIFQIKLEVQRRICGKPLFISLFEFPKVT